MEPLLGPLARDQELLEQRGFLRRLARGLLGDDALAEDVVQEAELRALERGPGTGGALRGWLVTVTRRLALNERRARERRARHEHAAARGEAMPGHDGALEGLEQQRAVLEAVRTLDEPSRTVLWQRYYEDRTPREIAARLGLPVATVKTRLRRGLQRLRAELDRKHGGRREDWAVGLAVLARPSAVMTLGGGLVVKMLAVAVALVFLAWFGWRGVRGEAELAAPPTVAASAVEPVPAPASESERAPSGVRETMASELALAPAPTAVAATAAAQLTVHASWAADGGDAAGVGLVLWPEDDPRAELAAYFLETGLDGRARFEAVPPGRYALHTDREGEEALELRAGEERELALTLPAGLDVDGLVLDGNGQPVAGAEVWLEGQGKGSLGGRVVAHAAAADGSFHLRALGSEQSLGAFAPGYAPAFLEQMRTKVAAPGTSAARVTLVLDREGRELHGLVLAPNGRPVSGARVALGTNGNNVSGGRNGRAGMRPRARVFTSGEDGEFRAWLEVGQRGIPDVLVHVLANGFALAKVAEYELGAPVHEVRVRLEEGATIVGHVRAPDGQPVAGALVSILSAGAIQASAPGTSSPFELPSARTRADGSYALEHVPSGVVELVVSLESDPRSGADETRVLAGGARETWDLALGAARVITGRVVDEQGVGLAGQAVLVSDGRMNSAVTTDTSGAFVFTPSGSSEEWDVTLMGAGGALDRRGNVRLGTEVVLVARVHRAAVAGGFTDRAGLAPEGESIIATLRPASDHMAFEAELDAQGAFAFEGLSPGTYRVTIESGDVTLARSPEFDLAEDQVLELDWLESGAISGPR